MGQFPFFSLEANMSLVERPRKQMSRHVEIPFMNATRIHERTPFPWKRDATSPDIQSEMQMQRGQEHKNKQKKIHRNGPLGDKQVFFGHEPLSRSERMDRQTDRHISSCHAFCHVYQLFSCFLSCISAAVMFFVMHISCCHAFCHAYQLLSCLLSCISAAVMPLVMPVST